MPLVVILPILVSTDRALALVGPDVVVDQGSAPQNDMELVDMLVEGVSRNDHPPPDPEDKSSKEVGIVRGHPTTK